MIVIARRALTPVASTPLGTPTAPTATVTKSGGGLLSSAEFTPAAGSLLFVTTAQRAATVIATVATASDTGGHVWSLVTDESYDVGSGNRVRQAVYCTAIGSAPSAITVSMDTEAIGRTAMSLLQITGASTIPSNKDTVSGATASLTTVLPVAPAATSTLLSFYSKESGTDPAITTPPGFVAVEDVWDTTGNLQMQTSYDALNAATGNTWTSSTTGTVIATVEITQSGIPTVLSVPYMPTAAIGANAFTVTSAPFDPPANSLLLACTFNRNNTTLPALPTIIDNAGGSITWTLLNSKSQATTSATRARMTVYGAIIGSTPPTGLTVTSQSNMPRCSLQLIGITGTTAIPTNFDPDDGAPNSVSLTGDPISTLPTAPAATSYVVGFCSGAVGASNPVATPVGCVEVEDTFVVNGNSQMQSVYLTGSTATTMQWTTTQSDVTISCMVEVPQP